MNFLNQNGIEIVQNLVSTIQSNKEYLSRIDGEIGDGDHGINMNKGFTIAWEEICKQELNMSGALLLLSKTLMTKIGGSMGPLYGTIFKEMAKASQDAVEIDKSIVGNMLENALSGIRRISPAKVGDKTLIDVLTPAAEAYQVAVQNRAEMDAALLRMKEAAEKGKESTRDMVAKIGRSSRLGERSRGVLDAGAVSCNLILQSFADTVLALIK